MPYEMVPCAGCGTIRRVAVYHDEPRNKLCYKCAANSPEMKAKRVANSTGRKHTEATKEKIRLSATGKFGKDSSSWKGGQYTEKGYTFIKLTPDDFFYPMAKHDGYVYEHRLVMARSIGRCLHRWEVVHHKNHNRGDNRIDNLQLVSDDRHYQLTILEERIKYLESKVDEQGKLIKLLQWQLKNDRTQNDFSLRKDSTSLD